MHGQYRFDVCSAVYVNVYLYLRSSTSVCSVITFKYMLFLYGVVCIVVEDQVGVEPTRFQLTAERSTIGATGPLLVCYVVVEVAVL